MGKFREIVAGVLGLYLLLSCSDLNFEESQDPFVDAYADFFVGTLPISGDSSLYLFQGSETSLVTGEVNSQSLQYGSGDEYSRNFARFANLVSDLNGDGIKDLVALTHNGTDTARVLIFYSGSRLYSSSPDKVFEFGITISTDFVNLVKSLHSANFSFGNMVEPIGDFDGDGFEDVAIGLPGATAFRIYFGSASGLDESTFLSVSNSTVSAPSYSGFGWMLRAAGDVNNDGFDDLLVGAPKSSCTVKPSGSASCSASDPGFVYLYYGQASRTVGSTLTFSYPDDTADTHVAGGGYGLSISRGADINNDGFSDFILGAPFAGIDVVTNGWSNDRGKAYIYYGQSTISPLSYDTVQHQNIIMGNSSYDTEAMFGAGVSMAGDINQDGYDDFLIGAPGSKDGVTSWIGRVYLFYGSASGVDGATAASTIDFADFSSEFTTDFGLLIRSIGDIDNDGRDDFAIGANKRDFSGAEAGAVFLFSGAKLAAGSGAGSLIELNEPTPKAGNYFGTNLGN